MNSKDVTTDNDTVLYTVTLSPKRWRYTGLGSKMNDKQAMTYSPVTSLVHATAIPKGCLVTLRTLVGFCFLFSSILNAFPSKIFFPYRLFFLYFNFFSIFS